MHEATKKAACCVYERLRIVHEAMKKTKNIPLCFYPCVRHITPLLKVVVLVDQFVGRVMGYEDFDGWGRPIVSNSLAMKGEELSSQDAVVARGAASKERIEVIDGSVGRHGSMMASAVDG